MAIPKKSTKEVRSRSEFSYKTDAHTPLATVFAYLNGKTSQGFTLREGKQRATDALLAFWKPYALKANKADPAVVKEAAISSVEALFRQLQRLCADFEVESPCSPSDSVDFNDLLAALTARAEQLALQSQSHAPVPTQAPDAQTEINMTHSEVIFVNDAELLGDLL